MMIASSELFFYFGTQRGGARDVSNNLLLLNDIHWKNAITHVQALAL